jgi:hypothetical protein
MTGDPLRDVKARAALVTAPDRTALTLTVHTEALVDTSIALPDVLSRLLAHPSVATAIPAEAPMRTATRLLRTNAVVHFSLNRSLRVRIGAAAGLADPVLLDRELRSGMNAGLEIASALSEGRISLARLSRLARLKTALAVNSPH